MNFNLFQTKSNGFRVTDVAAFCDLMSHCYGDDEIRVFTDVKDRYGNTLVSFGVNGLFRGFNHGSNYDEWDPERDLSVFTEKLQALLDPNSACILTTVGIGNRCEVEVRCIIIAKRFSSDFDFGEEAKMQAWDLIKCSNEYDEDTPDTGVYNFRVTREYTQTYTLSAPSQLKASEVVGKLARSGELPLADEKMSYHEVYITHPQGDTVEIPRDLVEKILNQR